MTTEQDFTESEWKTILQGPTTAGMIVITAEHGGTFRETYSMAKAYAEAREQHGASELLDAVVSKKPVTDHTHYHSPAELKQAGLGHLREAAAALAQKATPAELEDYRSFVLALCARVAQAHKEHGSDDAIGPAEREAIDEIGVALGSSGDGAA